MEINDSFSKGVFLKPKQSVHASVCLHERLQWIVKKKHLAILFEIYVTLYNLLYRDKYF